MQVAASTPVDTALPGRDAETAWLEFRHHLRAFVARRVSNHADVDDIVQWAFLQMHRSLGEIRSRERIHAWLYSTARRAIADYYRSGSRRRELLAGDALDLDVLARGSESPPEDGSQARQEVASCLAPILERLSPTDRDAIVLTEIRGLRLAEAAAGAGVSVSGMKSRVQRARHRLRRAMLACCDLALDARGAPTRCVKREPVEAACCQKPAW